MKDVLQNFVSWFLYFIPIGMDLSKAFDCMPHGLLLAKLFAYGVVPNACLFISTYLKNRMQRVKIMGTSSDWATINRGVAQGSVLGPLLFNIFLNDLFYLPLNNALVNYADDNHLCNSNKNLDVLQKELESGCARAVQWFAENQTTANSGKFQSILLSRRNIETFNINIGDHIISRNNALKIQGITLAEKLNINEHIRNICQTSSRQINALRGISKFLNKKCREYIKVLLMQILAIVPLYGCCVASADYEKLKNCKKEHCELCIRIASLITEVSLEKVVS